MRYLFSIFSIITFLGCTQTTKKKSGSNEKLETIQNVYAKGFKISHNKDYSLLEVYNPWQKANNVTLKYYLVKSKSNIIKEEDASVIQIPLKKVVCLSTTHISFIDTLGFSGTIRAISGTNLLFNNELTRRVKTKEIYDVGYESTLNYEILVSLKPDVIFVYGIESETTSYISKLKELGIQAIYVGEYLETTPLAKAEWIKFFAEFYNVADKAESIFEGIKEEYNGLKEKVTQIESKPSVAASLPWNGNWYISGGKSYVAELITDAGANYVWNDLDTRESVPVDFELVFSKTNKADYWINLGSVHSKSEILSLDVKLKMLKPFVKGNLYNNNARENINGGNDYWESGTIKPNIILKDLISIFHPEVLPGYKPLFYKKIY